MGKLQINVLGTSFSIKASEDDEYLNKLLGYYTKLVDEIKNSGMLKTELDISILAGIMLCDELYKEKSKSAEISSAQKQTISQSAFPDTENSEKVQLLTQRMIKKLEQALKDTETK